MGQGSGSWLPSLDSNQGCVIQSHECYHYTTRQCFGLIDYTTVSFVHKGKCDKMPYSWRIRLVD